LGDAFIRRQNIVVNNKSNPLGVTQLANGQHIIRYLNKDLKQQYSVLKDVNQLKSINLYQNLNKYSILGYLLVVQYLVNPPVSNFMNRKYKGANIHAKNNGGLLWAAKKGHLPIVQYLLQPYGLNNFLNRKYKGANIHSDHYHALIFALLDGHLTVVQYLLSLGANPNVLTPEQKVKFNI